MDKLLAIEYFGKGCQSLLVIGVLSDNPQKYMILAKIIIRDKIINEFSFLIVEINFAMILSIALTPFQS